MHWKRSAGLLAAAALAVTSAACGTGGGPAGTTPTAATVGYNPQPRANLRDGGSVTTAYSEITAQFNPFQGNSSLNTHLAWDWYNPRLISFTENGDPIYHREYLTEDPRAETVDGNTRVTYTINPKAVYNDGTPIDWTSFAATWMADNGKNPTYSVDSSDGYDRIASVTRGADDKQAVVTFRGVYVWWSSLFGTLLNPKALDPTVFNEGYLDNPHPEWGAGPYQLTTFDKQNRTLTFERNPKWWGEPGKLDRYTVLGMDIQAQVNAFRNGQLDVEYLPYAEQVNQVRSVANTELHKAPRSWDFWFQFNARSPVFADPAIRKAVMQGVDRAQVSKIVFQGMDYTEPLPGSLLLLPLQQGYQDNVSKVITFDPERAKAELDAAGYLPGPDGIRTRNGKPLAFDFVYAGDTTTQRAVATAVVAMMKNIGVTATIRQLPTSEYSSTLKSRSFDVFFNGYTQPDPYGAAHLCQLYCSDSTVNLSGSGNPQLDAQIKAVATLPARDAQLAAANAAEVEAFRTYGVLPVYNGVTVAAARAGLANYGPGWGGTSTYWTPTPQDVGWQK